MAVQPNCPEENQTWVVGVTAGRSAAEEATGLDTHQGQRPCPSTISPEAGRRLRRSSRRLRRTRDGGWRFDKGSRQPAAAPGRRRGAEATCDGFYPLGTEQIFLSCSVHCKAMRLRTSPPEIVSPSCPVSGCCDLVTCFALGQHMVMRLLPVPRVVL